MRHLMIFGLIALLAAPCVSGQEMDQAQQEMMKKWQAFMTPGQYHEQLAYYTGDWTYTGNNWMAPGAPPSPTSGTAQGKMILGGRYLKQTYQGNSMGMTFDGVGITAFDNHLKMFHSIWIDSLGTGIFSSMGKPGDGKVREETGDMADPTSGENVTMRNVFTVLGPDSYKMEMYNKTETTAEFKSMELVFSRKK